MNWHRRMINSLEPTVVLESRAFTFKREGITKTAYTTRQHITDISRQNDADGATCKVSMVESKAKYAVNVTYTTDIYAFPLFEETWIFAKGEGKRAIKVYNRIVNILEDLKAESEDAEVPTPSIQGKVREELRFVDVDRKKPPISISQAASRHEPGETDWRQTIYGNRYPNPTVVIQNDGTIYLNNG